MFSIPRPNSLILFCKHALLKKNKIFVRFFLDQRQLPINRKQKVFPNGTLIIENVERLSDQASYTCVARNAQGYSVRGTLEVQVMGECLLSFLNNYEFNKIPIWSKCNQKYYYSLE